MKNQNGESVEKIFEEVAMQGVAAVATGSPAVIEAEPFLDWLTERIIELQRGREAAHQSGDYATAERRDTTGKSRSSLNAKKRPVFGCAFKAPTKRLVGRLTSSPMARPTRCVLHRCGLLSPNIRSLP